MKLNYYLADLVIQVEVLVQDLKALVLFLEEQ